MCGTSKLVCLVDIRVCTELSGLAAHRSLEAILKDVEHHQATLYPPLHPAVHKSVMLDDMKCYTDYEPRSVREVSLKDRVVAGLAADEAATGNCPLV
jgi:hypothetical protein